MQYSNPDGLTKTGIDESRPYPPARLIFDHHCLSHKLPEPSFGHVIARYAALARARHVDESLLVKV